MSVNKMLQLRYKIKYAYDGGAVTRYHTVRTLKPQTVGDHTFGVVFFTTLLTQGKVSRELLLEALAHDLPEQIYGDIPAPAKRALNGSAYKLEELEDTLNEEHDMGAGGLRELTPQDKRVLKMADILDGMMYCISEMELGNGGMLGVYYRYLQYITDMIPVGLEKEIVEAVRDILPESI